MYTFDGANKLIILPEGMTVLDVKDLYSRWKEWVATSDNLKYLPFFDVVGGNQTAGSNSIASYFYLINGARIRPYEGNHTLSVQGILLGENDSDPFTDTLGNYRVRIVQTVPMQAETITVSSDGGSGTGPTADQIANAVRSKLAPELNYLMTLQNGAGLNSVQATMLLEIYRLYGLDPTVPLVVTDTSRTAGTIVQNINSTSTSTTVQRL